MRPGNAAGAVLPLKQRIIGRTANEDLPRAVEETEENEAKTADFAPL